MTTAAVAAKVVATGIGCVLLLRFCEAKTWLHLLSSQSISQARVGQFPSV